MLGAGYARESKAQKSKVKIMKEDFRTPDGKWGSRNSSNVG